MQQKDSLECAKWVLDNKLNFSELRYVVSGTKQMSLLNDLIEYSLYMATALREIDNHMEDLIGNTERGADEQ